MTDLFTFIVGIPAAFAQGPCVGVTNCGIGINPLPGFIAVAAAVLVEIASGLAALFVVIGGALIVMNFSNESQIEKGKKAIIFSLIGYAIALSSQVIISFVYARASTVDEDVTHLSLMRVMVDSMLGVFNAVFALMMLFYGFKLVIARGDQSSLDSVKKGLRWTAIGAICVNVSYALVHATELLGF